MHSFCHSGGACAGLDPVAGIQCSQTLTNSWTPFFNGVTTFYEIIKGSRKKKFAGFEPRFGPDLVVPIETRNRKLKNGKYASNGDE